MPTGLEHLKGLNKIKSMGCLSDEKFALVLVCGLTGEEWVMREQDGKEEYHKNNVNFLHEEMKGKDNGNKCSKVIVQCYPISVPIRRRVECLKLHCSLSYAKLHNYKDERGPHDTEENVKIRIEEMIRFDFDISENRP